jgi:hypothetical protein
MSSLIISVPGQDARELSARLEASRKALLQAANSHWKGLFYGLSTERRTGCEGLPSRRNSCRGRVFTAEPRKSRPRREESRSVILFQYKCYATPQRHRRDVASKPAAAGNSSCYKEAKTKSEDRRHGQLVHMLSTKTFNASYDRQERMAWPLPGDAIPLGRRPRAPRTRPSKPATGGVRLAL